MAHVNLDFQDQAYPGVSEMSEESSVFLNKGQTITLETRFGLLSFKGEQAIEFPQGLFGFSNCRSFGLANLPSDPDNQFKILQSLEDQTLSFIVLPQARAKDGLIKIEHLDEALNTLGMIDYEEAAILLIVTIRPQPGGGIRMTCNTQAPVLVDSLNRKAWQVVLSDSRYNVQHSLAGD